MKSPFLVYNEFISPLQCEEIIAGNNNIYPNFDKDGNIKPLFFGNNFVEMRILPKLRDLIVPDIESHFNVEVKGIKPIVMEWYSTGYIPDNKPRCENSAFMKGEWKRINDNDFTGIIFLNDYQDETPFDSDFEVFGGQLEFPTHQFSFNPVRGTLIIFPGASNFINATAEVKAGELTQIRFHIATHDLFVYDANHFRGNHEIWFKGEQP